MSLLAIVRKFSICFGLGFKLRIKRSNLIQNYFNESFMKVQHLYFLSDLVISLKKIQTAELQKRAKKQEDVETII